MSWPIWSNTSKEETLATVAAVAALNTLFYKCPKKKLKISRSQMRTTNYFPGVKQSIFIGQMWPLKRQKCFMKWTLVIQNWAGTGRIQKMTILTNHYIKFYPKKLSTNKSRKKYYPEVLSKIFLIQNVHDLFYLYYLTLYNRIDVTSTWLFICYQFRILRNLRIDIKYILNWTELKFLGDCFLCLK